MLDSVYHMTSRLPLNLNSAVKTYFCHYVVNVVMGVITFPVKLVVYRFYCMALFHSQTRRHTINRGYLLFWGEYQIYFIKCGEKTSIFHDCIARVKMLIFSPHSMKYIWYLPKKSKSSFYFILNGNTEITTLLFTWSFLVRFDFCSVFIGYNIGCKHSLHLKNGLESYFNE